MVTNEQIKKLQIRRDELYKYLDILSKKTQAQQLEITTQSKDFWQNPKEAESLGSILDSIRAQFVPRPGNLGPGNAKTKTSTHTKQKL